MLVYSYLPRRLLQPFYEYGQRGTHAHGPDLANFEPGDGGAAGSSAK
jgi:hypothetical protein